jgi:uncharacterized protein (DUF433 family)
MTGFSPDWTAAGRRRGFMETMVSTLIEIDDRGAAWVSGTKVKVIEIALDKVAYGWSPEEIHFQHPELSLAQIHSALAYYYEHQSELDTEIIAQAQRARELAEQSQNSPGRLRLRKMGLLK